MKASEVKSEVQSEREGVRHLNEFNLPNLIQFQTSGTRSGQIKKSGVCVESEIKMNIYIFFFVNFFHIDRIYRVVFIFD